ncbi:hypothetical protein K1719_029553 [Acacia pycnantha]|nr:hypothetical protein K1719_029553 [Acacia pycnantha]
MEQASNPFFYSKLGTVPVAPEWHAIELPLTLPYLPRCGYLLQFLISLGAFPFFKLFLYSHHYSITFTSRNSCFEFASLGSPCVPTEYPSVISLSFSLYLSFFHLFSALNPFPLSFRLPAYQFSFR